MPVLYSTIPSSFLLLMLLICGSIKAQQKESLPIGIDTVKIYRSLSEAMENPTSVIRLSLRKQKLSQVPEQIRHFSQLRELDLSINKIDSLPEWIGNLKHLERLSIEKNSFSEFPIVICSLTGLKYLVISRNTIRWIPACMGRLAALEVLDGWDNEFTRLPASMEENKALRVVDMRGINMNNDEQALLLRAFPKVKFYFSPGCNCAK